MTEFEYSYHGYTPEQADLIWATFDPQEGREIQKRRPALVVSSTEYNKKNWLHSNLSDYKYNPKSPRFFLMCMRRMESMAK
nr:type II toxin-antitoxin system PemK/MazF family toxin [Lentilactobacillus otakiensis]